MPPADLAHRLRNHGQEHLLAGWDALDHAERDAFIAQLSGLDFAELEALYRRRDEAHAALPSPERIQPLPVETRDSQNVARGEAALRAGQVAVLLVAGGQGTRLGLATPKGMMSVGPVSGATLFQIHAEKVLALRRKYGAAVPFLVMTSPATHADTVAYFRAENFFGLPPGDVTFFQQGTMPALDRVTGKLLLDAPGRLALGPNGHGGTLTALADTGLLAALRGRGVEHVFYFQVDNPLVRIADPAFLARHIEAGSEASSKVVFKERPEEKVGILAVIDGRCGIIEYSDLPASMAAERDANGLRYRAGNPAIHCFRVSFLEKVTSGRTRLAYHVAKKKVPYYDPATGETVKPTTENALKFELFVFDALPLAATWLAMAVRREDEFSPLKNATGADSAETVHRDQLALFARWLETCGVRAGHPVEIAPTYALDEADLARKLPAGFATSGPTYLR